MAKNDNLTDLLTDVADAIRDKKGTSAKINPQDFSSEIASIETGIVNQEKSIDIANNGIAIITPDAGYTGLGKVMVNVYVASSGGGGGGTPSGSTYTGHADAEGLRAIGWTDEDIEYYQQNGVNWNEEDDQYHLVTDDNKALYGMLTADNISTYKDRIVYLPKIDTSGMTSMSEMFTNCWSLVAIPQLDTQNVTDMSLMFIYCYSLVSIPQLDTSNVKNMGSMFQGCYSLVSIPQLDTSNVTSMEGMFTFCYSLVSIPQLDTSKVLDMGSMFYGCYSLVSIPQLDTSNVTSMYNMFYNCYSLVSIPQLDTAKVLDMGYMFYGCRSLMSIAQLDMKRSNPSSMFSSCLSLTTAYLKNTKYGYQLYSATNLSKESLLYIIYNEATTSAITIKLASYAYERLANDTDVVEALANHPNISISA